MHLAHYANGISSDLFRLLKQPLMLCTCAKVLEINNFKENI